MPPNNFFPSTDGISTYLLDPKEKKNQSFHHQRKRRTVQTGKLVFGLLLIVELLILLWRFIFDWHERNNPISVIWLLIPIVILLFFLIAYQVFFRSKNLKHQFCLLLVLVYVWLFWASLADTDPFNLAEEQKMILDTHLISLLMFLVFFNFRVRELAGAFFLSFFIPVALQFFLDGPLVEPSATGPLMLFLLMVGIEIRYRLYRLYFEQKFIIRKQEAALKAFEAELSKRGKKGQRASGTGEPSSPHSSKEETKLNIEKYLSSSNPFLRKLNKVIRKNFHDVHWNCPELVQAMNYSDRQLARLMAEHTSGAFSPARYLAGYRIHQSLTLLETTDLSLGEIAYQVGFSSNQQFRRNFKNFYGTNPSDFRKEKVALS